MVEDKLIGVPLATAVGLGAIIGAGIFVLSGTSIALAGADALIAFVVVGLAAIILALEMGELSSLMPDVKGASYSYTFKAFGSRIGFITGIFRYLSLAVSISVVSLGFGAYLSSLLKLSASAYSIPFAIHKDIISVDRLYLAAMPVRPSAADISNEVVCGPKKGVDGLADRPPLWALPSWRFEWCGIQTKRGELGLRPRVWRLFNWSIVAPRRDFLPSFPSLSQESRKGEMVAIGIRQSG
jgi:Amino acid permease